ncbi:sulfatase-like protein [uncultured Roseobacter sp.]|uniref:sulfatase-like protein n=1 Tax=uncultured Roseobacter sp. TaxID=114847 RepID=UPI002622CD55|nr:sulfatase-like protein [uncultured Roseobacter sp.]
MKKFFFLSLGALVIFFALVLPNHSGMLKLSSLNRWPLELPVLLLCMIAFGRRAWVVWALALVLVVVTFMKLADIGMFAAYNRTFNPILDASLINAGISLLSDSIGTPLTYLLIAGVIVAMVLWLFALVHSLRVWAGLEMPNVARIGAVIGAFGFGGWAVADAGHHLEFWKFERSPPGTAWTSRLAFKRAAAMRATAIDLAQFSEAAQNDIYADATNLMDGLDGHDVILIYIESYGRASFDNALYAPTHMATLESYEPAIADAGFAMRSGWLTSPTAGGQSWLAHGSLASGLWTSDNGRYTAMLASGHKWLFHFAQDAGYRTATVMPAITMAWPESSKMGFELVIPATEIPYKGERFNWVTMPDQFTLATYPSLLPDDPRPDFLQIALISSHAPWVPVPDMVAWEGVGDGTIFNEMAARGPTPRELWKNRDDIREAYRKAVDYSLNATLSHVARLGDQAPLVFIIGDHQAAGFVAGSDNMDVPVHMIGPPGLVALIESWGWSEGLIPQPDGPVRRMDSFRNDFIDAFSGGTQVVEVQDE